MSSYFIRRALAAYGESNEVAAMPSFERADDALKAGAIRVDPTAYIGGFEDTGVAAGMRKDCNS